MRDQSQKNFDPFVIFLSPQKRVFNQNQKTKNKKGGQILFLTTLNSLRVELFPTPNFFLKKSREQAACSRFLGKSDLGKKALSREWNATLQKTHRPEN